MREEVHAWWPPSAPSLLGAPTRAAFNRKTPTQHPSKERSNMKVENVLHRRRKRKCRYGRKKTGRKGCRKHPKR